MRVAAAFIPLFLIVGSLRTLRELAGDAFAVWRSRKDDPSYTHADIAIELAGILLVVGVISGCLAAMNWLINA